MSDWIEFTSYLPYKHQNVWISNGKKANFYTYSTHGELLSAFGKTWIYWTPVEKPELPKNKFHECETEGLICLEIASGLKLITYTQMGRKTDISINVCPFCGYSPKVKS